MKKLIVAMILSCVSLAHANAQDKVKGPSINFAKDVHNYGTISNGADGTCEFKFTNDGTEPLKITNCRASCGCTVPSWPKTEILPGKSSTIKVKYDTKRTGNIYKTITITSNATNAPRKVISIKGKVNPPESKATAQTAAQKAAAQKAAAKLAAEKAVAQKAAAKLAAAEAAEKAKLERKTRKKWYQFWKKKAVKA